MQDIQVQIKNTQKALEILEAAPEPRINLANYARITECGTLFCALGWIGRVPYFIAQGISIAADEDHKAHFREDCFLPRLNNARLGVGGETELNALFGTHSAKCGGEEDAWALLFSARGDSPYDVRNFRGSDKKVAVNRFREHLANLKIRSNAEG